MKPPPFALRCARASGWLCLRSAAPGSGCAVGRPGSRGSCLPFCFASGRPSPRSPGSLGAKPSPLLAIEGMTRAAAFCGLCALRWFPALASRVPPVWPGSIPRTGLQLSNLVRMSNAVECFSGPRPFPLWRPDPRAPCCCCARPSGLPRGPVPLLVAGRVCCFGWLAGLLLLVRLLASRCLWLRLGGGWPRAAGLLLLVLLFFLVLVLSWRGWPCPPRVLVVPLWLLVLLLGAVVRPSAASGGAGVPPALRRSSSRVWGWLLLGGVVLGLLRWPSPFLRW